MYTLGYNFERLRIRYLMTSTDRLRYKVVYLTSNKKSHHLNREARKDRDQC